MQGPDLSSTPNLEEAQHPEQAEVVGSAVIDLGGALVLRVFLASPDTLGHWMQILCHVRLGCKQDQRCLL